MLNGGREPKEQSEVAEHHFDNFPLATGLLSKERHTLFKIEIVEISS